MTFSPTNMVTKQVTNLFVVIVDFLTALIIMMKLWQTEYFR